ncbi:MULTISPECIES: hypothetical protein [unclassified Sphingomonas]|jgi:hypothetical protein|uniref:hypothetical protein n=1 Tax=unclassified Sphingomonas TaxID=196159 RepID=UPI000E100C49|nr:MULTISPECIES: hypothetical protein [unclassified Sphingomonas]AXJ94322.1 hypothetical protein DM480_01275 [Sphingomonas sp. FARSPH]
MSASDPHPDSPPAEAPDTNPDSPPAEPRDDPRPDIQQVVEARADAVARGEGGEEPARFTDAGAFDGNSGTGGEVKNQDLTQQ